MEWHCLQPAVPETATLLEASYIVLQLAQSHTWYSLMAEKQKGAKIPFKRNVIYCYIYCQLRIIFPFCLLNLMENLYSVTLG